MNAVIGTAGHVDHGKSSLINALTGIHPSHLPEELKRAMTIDLGFAYFTTPDNDKIGIIDVPGHERFIRNMASAVWGLDLVLFVVAADEGWAQLSTEHLKIIAALGIRQVILVLTKSDLVDKQRLIDVEDEALEHFLTEMNLLPETAAVSAISGEGMDGLKQQIVQKLHRIPEKEYLVSSAHLYVDRVFSVNGIGTTVTGTLRGTDIKEGQQLTLFPGRHLVKIRSLQSYHTALDSASPYSRVAIGLKQVNKKLVQRGSCLVADPNSVEIGEYWIVQLNPEISRHLKKQGIVEVALGTTHTQAKCYVYADKQLARLHLNTIIPAFWGQPLLLIQQGGSHIIGAGRLLWSQPLSREQRQRLQHILPKIPLASKARLQDKLTLSLAINGYASPVDNLTKPDDLINLGDWWVKPDTITTLTTTCNDFLSQINQATSINELACLTNYPLPLLEALTDDLCQQGVWFKIDGAVALANMQDSCLSVEQQQLLTLIEQANKQGFDSSKSAIVGIRKLLRVLTQRNLIIPTENELFFSHTIYQQLVFEIMHNRQLDEIFSVGDSRDRTQLSRKQLIPILNRLEKDGWVKRVGNERQVCRVYRA